MADLPNPHKNQSSGTKTKEKDEGCTGVWPDFLEVAAQHREGMNGSSSQHREGMDHLPKIAPDCNHSPKITKEDIGGKMLKCTYRPPIGS